MQRVEAGLAWPFLTSLDPWDCTEALSCDRRQLSRLMETNLTETQHTPLDGGGIMGAPFTSVEHSIIIQEMSWSITQGDHLTSQMTIATLALRTYVSREIADGVQLKTRLLFA